MKVYKKENIPDIYHYKNNIRVRSVLLVADEGWNIVQKKDDKEKWSKSDIT